MNHPHNSPGWSGQPPTARPCRLLVCLLKPAYHTILMVFIIRLQCVCGLLESWTITTSCLMPWLQLIFMVWVRQASSRAHTF